jgi:uncharacterized Tic20 family protein
MNDLGGKSYAPSVEATSDEKTMAIVAYILSVLCCFIGPLIIFLIKKDSYFVKQACLQAIGFWVLALIAAIVLGVVTIFLGGIGAGLATVGQILYVVVACIRASEGKVYEFPLSGSIVAGMVQDPGGAAPQGPTE